MVGLNALSSKSPDICWQTLTALAYKYGLSKTGTVHDQETLSATDNDFYTPSCVEKVRRWVDERMSTTNVIQLVPSDVAISLQGKRVGWIIKYWKAAKHKFNNC